VFSFVHEEFLPQLKGLEEKPGATPRQKAIARSCRGSSGRVERWQTR
jgi:hypothetical protein